MKLKLPRAFLISFLLISSSGFSNVLQKNDLLPTEEIDNLQQEINNVGNRYENAERQYDPFQQANDLGDYLEIVKNIRISK